MRKVSIEMCTTDANNDFAGSLKTFVQQAQNWVQGNPLDVVSHRDFIVLAFLVILNRLPDEEGIEYYLKRLGGLINRQQVVQFLFESAEYRARFEPQFADRLHEARKEFIKTLPRAECIVEPGRSLPHGC